MMTLEFRGATHNIRDHGAAGDGVTLETGAIQAAIDACAATGGAVVMPPGRYLSGTLFMRSNVTLHLCRGATLLGSTDLKDFPPVRPALRAFVDNYSDKSLIYGENLENIGIGGEGVIDGQGGLYERKIRPLDVRPMILRFVTCRRLRVENVTLQHSPIFLQWYLGCEELWVQGVRGFNHCNFQNDFLTFDGCRNVIVRDCIGDSDDDGITLKSSSDRACENIAISNCNISTICNALKFGTESSGGFRNISVNNLVVRQTVQEDFRQTHKPGLAGIAISVVDGAELDGVTISNVVMRGCYTPFYLRLADRGRPYTEGMAKPPVGSLRNVNISNVIAVGAEQFASSITGIPGHPVENVSLSNVNITCRGGGPREDREIEVPELIHRYPDCHKFGKLPAYGFFCRHVRGLRLDNVQLNTQAPDARHGFYGEDIEDLGLDRVSFPATCGQPIRLKNVRRAAVRGCTVPGPVEAFVKVEGEHSCHVVVAENHLPQAGDHVETTADATSSTCPGAGVGDPFTAD